MFSKIIFKQTLRSNIRLWLIFTLILAAMSCLIIAIFNPTTMDQILGLMERIVDDPAIMARIANNFSLVNMLSMQFYTGMGILLPLIYLIITANALIASQVDRGSMAYILSTPIKRTAVVVTQGVYLILATLLMIIILTVSGLVTAEAFHGGVFFRSFTPDVRAVATHLDMENTDVADDLTIIMSDPANMVIGAEAREIDLDVYTLYLQMLLAEQMAEPGQEPPEQTQEERDQAQEMQDRFTEGLEIAAEMLEVEVTWLFFNLGELKLSENAEALAAGAAAAEMPVPQFVHIINMQLANEEILLDNRFDFSVFDYLMVNLGIFLLMFATGGISFLFSCVFNLTKNAVALGAGIPIAFYLFQTMAMVGEDMEFFRYFTMNTLYSPQDIVSGGVFWWQFAVLGAIGIVLYVLSVKIFKEKDLPL